LCLFQPCLFQYDWRSLYYEMWTQFLVCFYSMSWIIWTCRTMIVVVIPVCWKVQWNHIQTQYNKPVLLHGKSFNARKNMIIIFGVTRCACCNFVMYFCCGVFAVCSYGCIRQSLEYNCRCPKCNFVIDKKEDIFPNFMRMLNMFVVLQ